jgi:hypothetical protein
VAGKTANSSRGEYDCVAMTTFLLLRRGPGAADLREVEKRDERTTGRSRIRCPRCAWEPGRDDLWMCTCGHAWNTFDTGGVCPACGHRWRETQCMRCLEWSLHEAWYVDI